MSLCYGAVKPFISVDISVKLIVKQLIVSWEVIIHFRI